MTFWAETLSARWWTIDSGDNRPMPPAAKLKKFNVAVKTMLLVIEIRYLTLLFLRRRARCQGAMPELPRPELMVDLYDARSRKQ